MNKYIPRQMQDSLRWEIIRINDNVITGYSINNSDDLNIQKGFEVSSDAQDYPISFLTLEDAIDFCISEFEEEEKQEEEKQDNFIFPSFPDPDYYGSSNHAMFGDKWFYGDDFYM